MIKILIPLAGNSPFFDEGEQTYPKPLFEIMGLPMIQRALTSFDSIKEEKRFIFVIKKSHANKFHLDNTLRLLTNNKCDIIIQDGETKGACCSCLLAVEHINSSDPLIISNGDQVIEANLQSLIDKFREQNADAGVLYFSSVHPQWSYVKMDTHGVAVEVVEKNPISKHAIAGFYYYSEGSLFVRSAQETILKGNKVNDLFYISPSLNELILEGKSVIGISLLQDCYHSFYSLDRVRKYESNLQQSS